MIRKLKAEIREYVDKRHASLKMYRYKERGIDFILDKVVPKDAITLQLIADKHHCLMNNAPENYVYGEMIDINNAIASNLRQHLRKYAVQYVNNYSKDIKE